ncbi:MAG: acylneuraminate cytidylyltransferase family protein [Muribaculum sp.]|nr:acylneuraminate cytidylyltransferase family protein [Muribaculum sp.]
MIQDKRVLAMIPARGGSKGIKDKNILDLQGKPLIAYTIEAARNSLFIDDVVVSTDSEKIAQVAGQWGAWIPFLRPAELAGDHAPTLDAVLYTIDRLKELGYLYDFLVLLQPTSPLRTAEDIDNAFRTFVENGCRPLAAVCAVSEYPVLMRTIGADGQLEKLLSVRSTVRRQDMPQYYRINGSIYINPISELDAECSFNDNPIPYLMETDHSVDIDEEPDVAVAQYYLNRR